MNFLCCVKPSQLLIYFYFQKNFLPIFFVPLFFGNWEKRLLYLFLLKTYRKSLVKIFSSCRLFFMAAWHAMSSNAIYSFRKLQFSGVERHKKFFSVPKFLFGFLKGTEFNPVIWGLYFRVRFYFSLKLTLPLDGMFIWWARYLWYFHRLWQSQNIILVVDETCSFFKHVTIFLSTLNIFSSYFYHCLIIQNRFF